MELTLFKVVSDEKPREIAVQVLQHWSRAGAGFVEDVLEKTLSGTRMSPTDRALASELAYGIVRWKATLDWLIARKTRRQPQKPILQNLLRLGLYQIFWLDRIPNHAAVHETVESAKRCGCGPQAGFINAVLRQFLRETDTTRELLAALKTSQPHLGWSHPEWLVVRWQQRLGVKETTRLLDWNNRPPRNYARVNTLKIDAGKLLEQWRNENIQYDFIRRDWFDENLMFELKSHPPLAQTTSFQQGCFYVQDPSTLLAVRALDPHPGERILDFCAAPGGKTTCIAQFVNNQATVVAQDRDAERLKLIEENCARLGVTCVKTIPAPASGLRTSDFDRILVDAPCSNTGVMRRRADLRWRIRPGEITRLQTAQRRLLNAAAELLKPGGVLVYSTCSLEPEENHDVIDGFLHEHPRYRSVSERLVTPFNDGVDGAFVARLEKSI